MSSHELKNIITELGILANCKAFKLINDLLIKATAKISTMTEVKILTYARTTFACRGELPDWKIFVQAAYSELQERKLDANSLLQGLL